MTREMTKEEAVKVLETSMVYRTAKSRGLFGELTKAMDIAISALSEPPRPNIERMVLLLRKCHELLSKQKGSYYVLNILAETVFYDGAECDGQCLMEDIEYLLEEFDMRGEEE